MKKLFLSIVLVLCFLPGYSTQYFIAVNGDDANQGTISSPFGGFDKAYAVAQPGDTIWIRGGKHTVSTIWALSKAGSANAYYNIWGYTPDIQAGDSAILNVTASNGIRIQLGGQYWHIKGLVIQNSADNGMRIEGSYNIIENCTFRYNSDSGLTIQQSNGTMPNDGSIASYNLILNCDSYFNDKNTDNADGFACKLSPGAGNVFRGCRSWANGDDGWDFYYSRFQIIVEDCWTFRNGLKGGNGNGFKSNGSASSSSTPRTQAPHVYIRCIAFDHKYKSGSNNKGFDQNHNEGNVSMINCLSFDNEKNFAYQEDCQNGKNHAFRNCVAFEPYSESLARTLLPGEVINPGTDTEISYDKSNTWFGNTIDAVYNSWNMTASIPSWNPSRADYESLTLADAISKREADGSLPKNGFGRLKPESKLRNAGTSYTWELIQAMNSYPNNPVKPYYVKNLRVTTDDGMPDLGPFEIPSAVNPNNQMPTVSMTQPLSGTEFKNTELISLQATASDTDGSIARIEFYANGNLVGVVYSAPYKYDWTCTVPGNYLMTAKAYDNEGASNITAGATIKVVDANSGGNLGAKKMLLQLPGTSFTDAIQNKAWTTVNSAAVSGSHIKLTYSSSKGGSIISPSIDLSKYLPDSLKLTFASSGGGNRNLNIYISVDGGISYSSAFVQAGAANGISVPVKLKLSDKVTGENSFMLKLEAANTIEVWDVAMNGYEKIKSAVETVNSFNRNISVVQVISDKKLQLKVDLTQSMSLQIDMFNLQGVKVANIANQNFCAGTTNFTVNLNSYPSGMYFIRLSSGTEKTITKVILP
ncbi:MAG: Ig-like domain-containing protein [Paludibacter sp.]